MAYTSPAEAHLSAERAAAYADAAVIRMALDCQARAMRNAAEGRRLRITWPVGAVCAQETAARQYASARRCLLGVCADAGNVEPA